MRRMLLWLGLAGTVLLLVRIPRIIHLVTAEEAIVSAAIAALLPLVALSVWHHQRHTHRVGHGLLARTAENRRAIAGTAIVITLFALAVLAPVISTHSPSAQPDVINLSNQPPSWAHPFGTDRFSRDLLSRVLYGARYTMAIALVSVLLALTIGTSVGLLAGLSGKVVDSAVMRFVDAGLAIPRIFLLMVMVALWDDLGVVALVTVLGLTGWFGVSRLVRAEVLALRSRDFVEAARAGGIPSWALVWRHILPNAASPLIVNAALSMGNVVLIEAALSYLGIGLRSPTPTWGNIIREGYVGGALNAAPWISTIPGLAIVITVLGFSLLGDGLREALDPRTQ